MQKQNRRLTQYLMFFQGTDTVDLINAVTQQNLKKHNIILLDQGGQFNIRQQSYKYPKLQVKYTEHQASIVHYEIIIAKFKLQITMINFDTQAPEYNCELVIGEGSFGTVRLESSSDKHFIVKRQKFQKIKKNISIQKQWNMNANKFQIDCVIHQYSFYKICSLYKIGPAVDTEIGFDLLCYNNYIEFHLEFCDKVTQRVKFTNEFNFKQFERQMKQNLRLIHKDIKPDNMLYSHKYKRYVFTDFGISHSVKENVGKKSKTFCAGTQKYMGQQMKKFKDGKKKQIDLYNNDRYGMKISFQQILQILNNTSNHLNKQNQSKQLQQKNIQQQQSLNQQEDNFYKRQPLNQQEDDIYNKRQKNLHQYQQMAQENYLSSTQIDIVNSLFDRFYNSSEQLSQPSKVKQQEINDKVENQIDKSKNNLSFKNSYFNLRREYSLITKQYRSVQNMPREIFNKKLFSKYPLFMSQWYYEYLKLKFIAIKNNTTFQKAKQSWNYLSSQQIVDILKIVLQSSDLNKKKQVEKIRKQIAGSQEQKLILMKITQAIDQKEITIVKYNMDEITQFKLRNYIRCYGYDFETLMLCQQLQKINKNDRYSQILLKIRYFYSERLKKLKNIDYTYDDKRIVAKQMKKKLVKFQNENIRDQKQILRLCIQIMQYVEQYEKQQYLTIIETLSIQRNEEQDIIYRIEKLYKKEGKTIPKCSEQEYKQIIQIIYKVNDEQRKCDYLKILFEKLCYYQQYQKGITIGQYIIELYKKDLVGMKMKIKLASIYHDLSKLYDFNARFQRGLEYSRNCIQIYIGQYGEKHPDIAAAYKQLSLIYYNMGKYQQALKYSSDSISIYKQYYGEQHPDIAAVYNQMSLIYSKQQNYKQALKYSQNSISIYKKCYGQQHPNITVVYNQLSIIYFNMGKYQQAFKYSSDSISIYKKYYGEQCPNIAVAYNQMSLIYSQKQNYKQALKYSQNSISIYKKYYGQQHPDIAIPYSQKLFIYKNLHKKYSSMYQNMQKSRIR